MVQPYTGGCACGAVRFEIAAEPLFQNHCQCLDCQHASGTGHGSYLTFARPAVKQSGTAATWAMTGDSGNIKTRAFCPTCGAPVFMTFSAVPDIFTVHAASLDEPARFKPEVITYAVRGHSWDGLDPTLTSFDRMPAGVDDQENAERPSPDAGFGSQHV